MATARRLRREARTAMAWAQGRGGREGGETTARHGSSGEEEVDEQDASLRSPVTLRLRRMRAPHCARRLVKNAEFRDYTSRNPTLIGSKTRIHKAASNEIHTFRILALLPSALCLRIAMGPNVGPRFHPVK